MDMTSGREIREAGLGDWRKLAQGLHARFRIDDFGSGADFVAALGAVGDDVGRHLDVRLGDGFADLQLVSHDAVYRDGDGTDHQVTWVTARDLDLARGISEIAASRGVVADPSGVSMIELALDTADPGRLAPVWAALLTGDAAAQGRGSLDSNIRDATGRVPNLWFQETDAHETPRQRFHVDVWLPSDVAEQRIEAAVAAGGRIVDDSQAPSYTVIADPEGNKACVCTFLPAAAGD